MSKNNVPEIITKSSRSEGAKKMWERRRSEQKEEEMNIKEKPMRAWVYHTEWVTLMSVLIGCFIFCYRESVHTNDRLDNHMEAINRRSDEISRDSNRRCDELHKEFYDLLKEMKRTCIQ